MDLTVSVGELLLFLLAILGMGALIYLIMLIRNANKVVSRLDKTLASHEEELDRTLVELPKITENITDITNDVNQITGDLSEILELTEDEIVELVKNVHVLSERLDKTSENVFSAIDTVSDSVSESALSIESSVKSLSDYIIFAIDVIDIIKKNLGKR